MLKKKEKQELKDKVFLKINSIFKNVEENKKSLADGLIEQYCFMYIQLRELNEIIEKKGVIDNFEQGKQKFTREQPAVKTYNATMKNYNLVTKQLIEILPTKKPLDDDDEFQKFNKR